MYLPLPRRLLVRILPLLTKERHWGKKAIRILWISTACLVVSIPLYIYLVILNPFNLFGPMPSLTQIENPENDLSSELISADGVSLGRYFRYNRSQLGYDQLPQPLVRTLLISEDHRFHDHAGMDFRSSLRVLFGMLTLNPQGGGSTLTQQTAKNLFKTRGDELEGRLASLGSPVRLLISKTKEWIISVRLERRFTKEEIIALYLNTVPFNNNAYGIKIASETYFNKRVDELNLQEIAVLVGLLQNNRDFDPAHFPQHSLRKRNEVLRKLLRHGYITSERAYDSIASIPLRIDFQVQNQNNGLATYFRSALKPELHKWCREHGYDLYESGLKIYTTIDSRMQLLAEASVHRHMKWVQRDFEEQWGTSDPWADGFVERKIRRTEFYKTLVERYGEGSDEIRKVLNTKKRMRVFTWMGDKDTVMSSLDSIRYYNRFLHAGMMAMDPRTGEIKAWVGGINHRYFKFDHVRLAKRQPGSTFKPFVYGKAMEDGYSPCDEFQDISPPISLNGKIYQVANSNGGYGDGRSVTLRQALGQSLNTVTIQLMDKLQPENVVDFAHRVGITTELKPVYSLGLGTSELSLFELVGAYSSFVNDGIYTHPYYISRIEDKDGNVLETFSPRSRQVISRETAQKIIYLLRGSVDEDGGTSQHLSSQILEDNEVGGKTGTTNNASDGWYLGLTHNLVTGVWVGGDEPGIRFRDWQHGSGGRTALPVWSYFMEGIYAHPETGYRKGFFSEPDSSAGFECDDFSY